jgi:carbon-monoxide dehydrogenase iron sulfur subunit
MQHIRLEETMEQYMIECDPSKCKGCGKCEIACVEAHCDLPRKVIIKNRDKVVPRIRVYKSKEVKMPIQCRQCRNAACARVCPTGALAHDGSMVRVREQFCLGCGMCVMACPFGAITVADQQISFGETPSAKPHPVALKCDQCEEWREKNGQPVSACVANCKFGALNFVKMGDLRSRKLEAAAMAQ